MARPAQVRDGRVVSEPAGRRQEARRAWAAAETGVGDRRSSTRAWAAGRPRSMRAPPGWGGRGPAVLPAPPRCPARAPGAGTPAIRLSRLPPRGRGGLGWGRRGLRPLRGRGRVRTGRGSGLRSGCRHPRAGLRRGCLGRGGGHVRCRGRRLGRAGRGSRRRAAAGHDQRDRRRDAQRREPQPAPAYPPRPAIAHRDRIASEILGAGISPSRHRPHPHPQRRSRRRSRPTPGPAEPGPPGAATVGSADTSAEARASSPFLRAHGRRAAVRVGHAPPSVPGRGTVAVPPPGTGRAGPPAPRPPGWRRSPAGRPGVGALRCPPRYGRTLPGRWASDGPPGPQPPAPVNPRWASARDSGAPRPRRPPRLRRRKSVRRA